MPDVGNCESAVSRLAWTELSRVFDGHCPQDFNSYGIREMQELPPYTEIFIR